MTLIRDPRERAEAVEQWAHLNGDVLDVYWPDGETRWVIENALWCAGDVLMLLADTAEPVAAEAGRPIPEPDRDDTDAVSHS